MTQFVQQNSTLFLIILIGLAVLAMGLTLAGKRRPESPPDGETEIDPTLVMPYMSDLETPIISRKELEEKLRKIQSGADDIEDFRR